MAINKETKAKIVVLIVAISSITLFLSSRYQTVEVMYFTNPKCLLTKNTDSIIEKMKLDFGDKIKVREIKVNMYADDQPDTEEIKMLREKYQVYGTPDIVIDSEKFTMSFTKDNLKKKICERFIIKPEACV